ncbi:hypothetical protein G7Y89_g5083 [Cudoniella acicularis]|uniref:Zn(2)-C6 fungal-type domain-containing protein n=1 Tax=Cudoniella acicularis TaxID=354080 RepID=A0A8H4W6T9_9HELO|nr:hypothetical protein G7Y89_g5083 [Cudoniella acicularis]
MLEALSRHASSILRGSTLNYCPQVYNISEHPKPDEQDPHHIPITTTITTTITIIMSEADTNCSAHVPAQEPLGDRPRLPSSRRREKAQLSCTTCRRRKIRCDRQLPCSNCSSRALGSMCAYPANTTPHPQAALSGRPHGTGTAQMPQMQDRINQLESLVLNLMHQTQMTPSSAASLSEEPAPLRQPLSPSLSGNDSERPVAAMCQTQREVSPSPSDYGSIRIQRTGGVSYVSSAHWAAVLDSIAELRTHFAQEDATHSRSSDPVQPQASFPKPQLLYYSPMLETLASILESIPPRPVVDRLVSRYFNVLDIAPGVVHSGQFLQEYEDFWKSPQATPIMWVGLLFTIICLSTQLQQASLAPTKTSPTRGHSRRGSQAVENQAAVDTFREKAIQCLILGHYTKGGPYVVETLILYFLVEVFHLKDVEIGIWILVGNIVQIAIHMGYHRDAKHFPNISPFAGEMRRRVWAMIVQIDFSISTQLGMPRLVKESQTDTAEPRNLEDSDFDEHTSVLPPSRPETEVTHTLYVLAKLRLLSVGVKVADVATEPRPHSYAEVLELDQQIDKTRDALPSSMKWKDLASSLMVPSQTIIQRIWLEVTVQQLKIVLHRKFLEPSRLHHQYASSRSACLTAAMTILEFQHLIDEETQTDGLLYQSRWRVSSAFINDFLLATSILCFCLQTHTEEQKEQCDDSGNAEVASVDKIRKLLRASQVIWSRQSATSREAQKAAAALRYVLGDFGIRSEPHLSEDVIFGPSPAATVSYFPGFSDLTPDYDLSTLGIGQENEGIWWQGFTANLNNNVEQWSEVIGREDPGFNNAQHGGTSCAYLRYVCSSGLDIEKPEDRPQFFHSHGTETPASDPQDVETVSRAFYPKGTSASDELYVGSTKTIIGHTEGTAGLASLMGPSLALQYCVIPPNMQTNYLF